MYGPVQIHTWAHADAHAVARHTTHFTISSKSHPYTVIEPLTPLEDLESFFAKTGTDFALGTSPQSRTIVLRTGC